VGQVNRHRGSVVVPAPIGEVYDWLHDVANWTRFLEGLETVEPLGYRRYRWTITYARRTLPCDVVVSIDPKEHRFAWKHQAGAPFDGTIRLTAVGEARTKVDLDTHIKPTGLLDGIVEFTGRAGWEVERDLQRLRDVVASGALSSAAATDRPGDEEDGEAVS
jgi:uncharacterized membrane protein